MSLRLLAEVLADRNSPQFVTSWAHRLHFGWTQPSVSCSTFSTHLTFQSNQQPLKTQRSSIQCQTDSRYSISSYHSGAAKDASLVGCDAVSLGEWFPTFRRIVIPHLQHYITEDSHFYSTVQTSQPLCRTVCVINHAYNVLLTYILILSSETRVGLLGGILL
jgi:hypothetical protein